MDGINLYQQPDTMFINYLKTSLRFIRRSPVFAVINVLGLAVGISCSLLILLYVNRELSFDRFHKHINDLYRLQMDVSHQGNTIKSAVTGLAMAPDLAETFPEIRSYARLIDQEGMLEHDEQAFREVKGFFADSNFFRVFTFPLLEGNPDEVISRPNAAVITRSLAQKVFGDLDPVGQVFTWNHQIECTVTGVAEDPPEEGHLDFDLIMPVQDYIREFKPAIRWDGGYNCYTYLLLQAGASAEDLGNKLVPYLDEKINQAWQQFGARMDLSLFPVKKIRMFADYDYELGRTDTFARTMIFAGIALLILLIAAFNYINLTTARSSQRSREVGIRKAVGATRKGLIQQFSMETLVMTLLAGILALVLVEVFQPAFNRLSGAEMSLYQLPPLKLIIGIPALLLVVGVLSSFYPATRLSAADPIRALRSMTESGTGKPVLRNILVILQYVISVVLIIGTSFVYLQLRYLERMDLGFNEKNLLVIPMVNREMEGKAGLLKEKLLALPQVTSAATGSAVPGNGLTMNGYLPEGYEKSILFRALNVDADYLSTLGIEVIRGRSLSGDRASDQYNMLVNESLARELGWADPIGKTIFRDTTFTVVGVIKDFHYSEVQQKINPMVLTCQQQHRNQYVVVRLVNSLPETLHRVEKVFGEVYPGTAYFAQLMEDRLSNMLDIEKKFANTVLIATILAVFLASLGLFALSLHSAERRTREIGIRKALGAGSRIILWMFIREFSARILLANLLAYPLVWYAMHRWLENYDYHIRLEAWVFAAGTLLSLLLTLLTVGFQSLRSAVTNPAKVLKYE